MYKKLQKFGFPRNTINSKLIGNLIAIWYKLFDAGCQFMLEFPVCIWYTFWYITVGERYGRAGPDLFLTAFDYVVKNNNFLFSHLGVKNQYFARYRVVWNPLWLWKAATDSAVDSRLSQLHFVMSFCRR